MLNLIDLVTSLIPYGGTADVLIKAWRDRKVREARDIYLSEVRDGIFSNIDVDDVISIAYRLTSAVSEGIAKNNFRLLCRLIQGLGTKGQLTAPNFLNFASILSSLTEREIKVIAFDAWKHFNPDLKNGEKAEYWENFLGSSVWWKGLNAWETFDDEHYALLRTGLYGLFMKTKGNAEITPAGGDERGEWEPYVEMESDSEPQFYFTELGLELIKYVDLTMRAEQTSKS